MKYIIIVWTFLFGFVFTVQAEVPVGDLLQDSPETPEQISLFIPITGKLSQTAKALVRYKLQNSSIWKTGHPLHRIRPSFAPSGSTAQIIDGFAWTIIDLSPGKNYNVEVTIITDGETAIKTGNFSTRSLPQPSGSRTKTIPAGSTSGQIENILKTAMPGDIIEFQNGTYEIGVKIRLSTVGTVEQPIYIRGESRNGVILKRKNHGRVFHFVTKPSQYTIFENMTLVGKSRDAGVSPDAAIEFHSQSRGSKQMTFRNMIIKGFDRAVLVPSKVEQLIIYDCTMIGNNDRK